MRFKEIHSYTHAQIVGILLFLSYLLLMFGNGVLSLTHPDEVFYIQSAKEMIAKNSWDTPYIFDAPQFEKPIFSYWLFMIAIKIFGLNAFAGRFAPALFGMLAVPVIYGITWVMFKNKRLSFLSGLVLMSSVIHLALSRAVLTDMIFSVWVMLSIGAFYWGYENRQHKNYGILLSFIFSGIAILTKGLLGFCFPAGTILLFLLLRKDFGFFKTLSTLWGVLLLLAIALPWHILMYQRFGSVFLQEYFQNVHIRRLLEAEHQKSNTWYFYLLTIISGSMPWMVFMIPAAGMFIRKLKEKAGDFQPFLFLLCWMIGIFIFVQPAHSKLASYILPIFPAVAIVLAYYLEKVISSDESSRIFIGFRYGAYVFAVFLGGVFIAVLGMAMKFKQYNPPYQAIFVFGGLMGVIVFAVLFNLARKNWCGVVLAVAGMTAGIIFSGSFAVSFAEPWVSCKEVSNALKKIDQSDSTILTSKFYVRGVRYYTDRPVAVIDINGKQFFSPHAIPFLDNDNKVRDFLLTQPVTFCIVREANISDLARITANNRLSLTLLYERGEKHIYKIERL